ncbi:GNAT family N-acetyltransferase [Roseovarius sp. S4756]|uniref:GNAT family N-acetyltransferase n=1 Tax=Roseovarius maritimus TaxID=3342637 RepID=UPI00372CD292
MIGFETPDTSTGRMSTTLIGDREYFRSVDGEWAELTRHDRQPSCFRTPAYFHAWASTEGRELDLSLLVARDGARLAGVMPLMRVKVWRGPSCAPRHDFIPADRELLRHRGKRLFCLRQLSPAASIPAMYIAPAPQCRTEDRSEVIGCMAMALKDLPGWDSFVVPVTPGETQELWLNALLAAGCRARVMPLGRYISGISNPRPFSQMVAEGSRNFRKNIRRAERAARKAGLTFDIHEGATRVAKHLPTIAEVAAQSWKAEGRKAADLDIPFAGRQAAFLRSLLAQPELDDTAKPVLAIAKHGDEPVAVLLSLQTGAGITALLTFRTQAVAEASPGLLLIGQMLDWASELGLHSFDLNITQNWARHLCNTTVEQNYVVAYAPSLAGRMIAAMSSLTERLKG